MGLGTGRGGRSNQTAGEQPPGPRSSGSSAETGPEPVGPDYTVDDINPALPRIRNIP